MCAHGVETLHEYPPFFDSLEELGTWLYAGTAAEPHGYVDGFSIIHHAELLKTHFADQPVVIVMRNPIDVRRSWESREGFSISDALFQSVMQKVGSFYQEAARRSNVVSVPYHLLDDYGVVNELVIHCTGRPLKSRTWQLFNLLKIELYKAKCPSKLLEFPVQ